MQPVAAADVLGGLQVELPGEHREPRPQQPLLAACTAHGSSRSPYAASGGAAARRGRRRSAAGSGRRAGAALFRGQGAQPPGGQFQRERDAVQPTAQLPRRPPVVRRPAGTPGSTAAARSANSSAASSSASGASGKVTLARPAPGACRPAASTRSCGALRSSSHTSSAQASTRCSKPSITSRSWRSARWSRSVVAGRAAGVIGQSRGPRRRACSSSPGRGRRPAPPARPRRSTVSPRRAAARAAQPGLPDAAHPGHGDQPGRRQQPRAARRVRRPVPRTVELRREIAAGRGAGARSVGVVGSAGSVAWNTERTGPYALRTICFVQLRSRRAVMRYGARTPGAIGSGDDDFRQVQGAVQRVRWRGGRDPGGRLLGDPGLVPRRRRW